MNNLMDLNANKFKTSVELKFILIHSKQHVKALQTLFNANVERRGTLTDATENIREHFVNGCSIDRLNHSVKISKLVRVIQPMLGLIESNDLNPKKMSGSVDKANHLRVEISKFIEA